MTHWYREPKIIAPQGHPTSPCSSVVRGQPEHRTACAYGRIQPASPRALSALLAGLGFVTIAVVPALKYPTNPPYVGNPDTIGVRTAAFFMLLAFSVVAMALAVKIESFFHKRWGGWNASLVAVVLFVVVITVVSHFLPDFNEVPVGFPVTLMWSSVLPLLRCRCFFGAFLDFPLDGLQTEVLRHSGCRAREDFCKGQR
jgi:Probable cobalt transporter subunit (CbtA)